MERTTGLRRLPVIGVIGWAVLVVSPVTAVLEPLTRGRDDSWAIGLLYLAANVGLGAAVQRSWALVVAALAPVSWFVAGGAEGLAWLAVVFGVPAVVITTGMGWLLGRVVDSRAWLAVAFAFAVAAVPVAWGAREWMLRTASGELPRNVQAQLPIELSLGNLCPHASTPAKLRKDLRRRTEVLLEELHRRPNALVRYTYYYEDGDEDRTRITVRELAEEQLHSLEVGSDDSDACAPDLQRRLRAALDE